MSAPIAAFLDGLVEGRERRRRWDGENEDREWQKGRRGRQLVLDDQSDEDRLSDRAWEGKSRAREETTWGQADETLGRERVWEDESRGRDREMWTQADEDRSRRVSDENYDRDRSRAADGREDADRTADIAAGNAAADAMASNYGFQMPGLPPDQYSEGQAQPAAIADASRFGAPAPAAAPMPAPAAPMVGQVAPGQPSIQAAVPQPAGGRLTRALGGRAGVQDPAAVAAPAAVQGRSLPHGVIAPASSSAPVATAAPVIAPGGALSYGAAAPAASAMAIAPGGTPTSQPAAPAAPTARGLPINTEAPEKLEQRANAGAQNLMQHFATVGVPKQVEHYLRTGQVEKAEAYQKFAEAAETKAAMGHLGKALTFAQIGDPKRTLSSMIDAYNSPYMDDGYTALPESWIERDDQTGQMKGAIVLRDDRTGEAHEIPIDGNDDLYQIGIGMLAPETVFEQAMAAMKPGEKPAPTSDMREYDLAVAQGYTGTFRDYQLEARKAGAASTTVTVGGDGAPGLGKLSTDFGYVLDPKTGQPVIDKDTGLPRAAAVPGSPAAKEAEALSKKADLADGARDTSTGVIVQAAANARGLIDGSSTGITGAAVSFNPQSNAAELYRQMDVLKSNATVENLTAMRAASPTGGALGAVSDRENAMLAAKAGALDPKSGPERFRRQLDDYELTLLKIVHGPRVGEAIFEQTRDAAAPAGGGSDAVVPPDEGAGREAPQEATTMGQQTAAPGAAPSQAPAPAVEAGVVEDGYRFVGGDPADPSSWEAVQ